jgi:hypothetical protein
MSPQPRHIVPPYHVALRTALWLFRQHQLPTEIEGLGLELGISRYRISQELDGDEAVPRTGNLPFAIRLMALVSMMSPCLNRLLPAAKSRFRP